MSIDAVIPYRETRSDELRHAIRSICANLKFVDKIFIIGDRPPACLRGLYHIPFRQTIDIAKNTLDILNIAASAKEISHKFVWTADDIYIMNPLKSLPVAHRGTYDDIIAERQSKSKFSYKYYTRRMEMTNERLKSLGVIKPLCYELHIPFLIDKKLWNKVSDMITPQFNKLSMYHNLNNLGGIQMKDVKVRVKDWVPDGDFISTHETTFEINKAGQVVRCKFLDRTKYECSCRG